MSDPHVVRSDADTPTLNDAEYDASPRLAPCTVTLEDPVPALFFRRVMLTMSTSLEKLAVALPVSAANDAITRRLP